MPRSTSRLALLGLTLVSVGACNLLLPYGAGAPAPPDGGPDQPRPKLDGARRDRGTTEAVRPDLRASKLEVITAAGKLWDFALDAAHTVITSGIDLRLYPHYAKWPCAPQAGPCRFDTHAYQLRGSQLVEVITANARRYVFDVDASYALISDDNLVDVPEYSKPSGPCSNLATAACQLETQLIGFYKAVNARIDSITARGRYWNYYVEGYAEVWPADTGKDLVEIARYGAPDGPCAGLPAGVGACHFETRVLLPGDLESITKGGKLYLFSTLTLTPTAGNNTDLMAIPHYAKGPCLAGISNPCGFDTRAIADLDIL